MNETILWPPKINSLTLVSISLSATHSFEEKLSEYVDLISGLNWREALTHLGSLFQMNGFIEKILQTGGPSSTYCSDPTWLATEAASEPDQGSESKAVSDAELKNLTFKHHIFNRSLSN
jgi:hypothetical protein